MRYQVFADLRSSAPGFEIVLHSPSGGENDVLSDAEGVGEALTNLAESLVRGGSIEKRDPSGALTCLVSRPYFTLLPEATSDAAGVRLCLSVSIDVSSRHASDRATLESTLGEMTAALKSLDLQPLENLQ